MLTRNTCACPDGATNSIAYGAPGYVFACFPDRDPGNYDSNASPISSTSKCVHCLDESDGENPDLKSLTVRYKKSDAPPEFIYMSGEQKDVITLSDTKFAVSRDHGADGLFEEDVCEGSIIFYGFSVRFRVPIDCLPDIATKRIWVYSIMSFTSSKDEDCPTEGVADIPSDIATLDPSEEQIKSPSQTKRLARLKMGCSQWSWMDLYALSPVLTN